MSEPTKTQLAKVTKLLDVQKDLIAKLHDCTREIDNLLGGKAGIGELMKRLERAFELAWCARYARGAIKGYVWAYAEDRAHMKRLLAVIPIEDLEARIERFIRTETPFYISTRHAFRQFARNVNEFAAEAADLPLAGEKPIGCTHQPPCGSDAEHTKRRSEAMRP